MSPEVGDRRAGDESGRLRAEPFKGVLANAIAASLITAIVAGAPALFRASGTDDTLRTAAALVLALGILFATGLVTARVLRGLDAAPSEGRRSAGLDALAERVASQRAAARHALRGEGARRV